MNLLIDTNAYSSLVSGQPSVVDAFQSARKIVFSVVVIGELRAGFRNGTRIAQNEEVLRQVLSQRRVSAVGVTESTAFEYAKIWTELKVKGAPIPTNDIWIAAQCIEHDLTLLTHDSHFRHVDGIRIYP